MSDEQLLKLMDLMNDGPRLVTRDRKYVVAGDRIVVVLERVGKGERWAMGSRSVIALEQGKVPQAQAWQFTTEALRFVYRAVRMNFAAHARAMGAHVR